MVRLKGIGEPPNPFQNVTLKRAEIGRCMPHIVPAQSSADEGHRPGKGQAAIGGAMGCYQQLSCARLARALPQHADFSSTWIGNVANRVRLRKPFHRILGPTAWEQSLLPRHNRFDDPVAGDQRGGPLPRAAHSDHSCAARAASSNALIAMR
jgi:hypothetical protein